MSYAILYPYNGPRNNVYNSLLFQSIPYFMGVMLLEFIILALQNKVDEHYSLADTVGSITAGLFTLSIT